MRPFAEDDKVNQKCITDKVVVIRGDEKGDLEMRKLRTTSMMIVFAFILLVFPPFLAFGQVTSWKWQNPLPQGNPLTAVWGSSGSDVFAVGGTGTILHYNGTK